MSAILNYAMKHYNLASNPCRAAGSIGRGKAEKVGLPPIMVHDLRHSHASLLINMGVDIKEISERLGHESVKTTWDTYAHLYSDTDTKLAAELNKLRRSGADES